MNKTKITKDEFINKSKKIHNNKYDYSLVNYINKKHIVKIICPKHGEFSQTPHHHLNRGQGCFLCSKTYIPTTKGFIEKSKEINGDKYDYSLVNYENSKKKVKIICPKHGVFEQIPRNHIHLKAGCQMCSKNCDTIEEFINKCNVIHNNKYDYSLIIFYRKYKKIKIICPKHGQFEQYSYAHLDRKQGCPCCYKEQMFDTKIDFINKSNLKHHNKYDYSLVNYENSKKKVKIICPKHGMFLQIPNDHIHGSGCSTCQESKGEKEVSRILDKMNIKYEREKRYKGCRYKNPLPFDFYLPSYNLCIEYDGMQHFRLYQKFGGLSSLEKQIIKDNIKTQFCLDNNIKLLRIRYDENINEKLKFLKNNGTGLLRS